MNISTRERFIVKATVGYVVGALAWIYLSDQLLALMMSRDSLVLLSNAKGAFFVLFTAGLLFLALRAVPANYETGQESFSEVLAAGVVSGRNSPWLTYSFAVVITLIALMLHQSMATFNNHLMLSLFMLPIILSAFLGGIGPGLLATSIAALGVTYLVIPPLHQLSIAAGHDRLAIAILLLNGLVVTLLCSLLQRSLATQKRNRRLLSAVVSGTTDAVFVKDLQGRYLLFNHGAEALSGRSAKEVLGRDDRSLFPLASAQVVLERDQEVLAAGCTQTHEEHLTMSNGTHGVFLVTKGPVKDEAGKVFGLFGVARDITERYQRKAALLASEAALREAQLLACVGSWRWSLQTGEHEWSAEIYRIYGLDPKQPPAKYPEVQQYFSSADWALLSAKVEHVIAHGGSYECDAQVLRADGSKRWITARGVAELAPDGSVIGLHGTLQDITERKLSELSLQVSEERLRLVLEATADGLWDWDLNSGRVYRSVQYFALTGTRPEEDTHDFAFFQRLVHPDDLPGVVQCILRHQQDVTVPLDFNFRLAGAAPPVRWLRGRGRVVEFDAQGAPARMVGTLTDVTEAKNAEQAQRLASSVFENSHEGIMVAEPDGRIIKINPAFTRITGYSAEEVKGQRPSVLSSGRHDQAFYAEMWRSVQEQGLWQGEIWNRRKSGEIYAEQLTITTVHDAAGAVLHYIGSFTDISQIKAHESELDRIAHYDPLTGTPNRRLLTDRLQQSISRTSRGETSLAVCFLDLDGFKAINDQYGHAAGDLLLVGITQNLKHVLRADDTLARLGGDEFVLLLVDIPSPEECSEILDRILSAIAKPILIDGVWVSVTGSVGVSLFPEDNADADTLLRHADQAMYLAKESGKNHYQLFDPESDRKAQTHRRYLDELRRALENREFILYYQPKVNLLSGAVFGVEALIRWQHPLRGLVSPAEFLPHVYGSSLEKPLGEWVLDEALAQASAWHACGMPVVVSVNVSANDLLRSGFPEGLKSALACHPELSAACLELEVLETAAIADMEHAVEVLRQCRELGVHFALDDFGTGYSSLTYLRKLPIDTLKIDQSFVRDMLSSPDDFGIVEAVIRMAAVFERQVIAEGVESLEHASALLRLGCLQVQGYGISRPMAADQFVHWVKQWQEQQAWQSLGGQC